MRCDEVRQQLTLLMYGELPDDEATRLREHVEQCAACANELEQWRAAQGRLDAWRPIEAEVPVGDVLARIDETEPVHVEVHHSAAHAGVVATVGPRRRFVPWIVGAAAGLALALGVLALGAQVQRRDGQLMISFGRSADDAVQPRAQTAALSDAQVTALRSIMNEQLDNRTAEMLGLVREQFGELQSEQDKRFIALVKSIGTMQEEDRQLFEDALNNLAMDTARQTQRTRAALSDVARSISMNQPAITQPKEIIP